MATRNTLGMVVLLAAVAGLCVLVGEAFGGAPGAVVGVVIGLGVAGGAYWCSDTLAIEAARAVPAVEDEQPTLYRSTRELASAARVPVPRLYVSPSRQPNAFTTGRSRQRAAVVLTAGILALLDEAELRAVLAHELAHVASRDFQVGSVAAALAASLAYPAQRTLGAPLLGRRRRADPLSLGLALVGIVLLPVAAGLLRLALPPAREFRADRAAAALVGGGEPLARALTKLWHAAARVPMYVDVAHATAYTVDPLRWARGSVRMAALLAGHPPIEERIARLSRYHLGRGHGVT